MVEDRDGDYFGSAVNRAARVMGVAHGGQILVSQTSQELLRDSLDAELGLVDWSPAQISAQLRIEFPTIR